MRRTLECIASAARIAWIGAGAEIDVTGSNSFTTFREGVHFNRRAKMTTQHWITGTAGDWSDAADWRLGLAPTSTDDAVIVTESAPIDDYPASTATTGLVAIGGSATGDGGVAGAYTISATAISAPPAGDYPASMATTAVDATGGSTIGDIGTTGDANSFKVTLAAGTTYQGGHSGEGTLQRPVLSLLDSSGNKLIGNSGDGDSGSGPTGSNDRITYTAPTSGAYSLAAQADGGGAGVNTVSATALSTTVAPVLTTVVSFNGSDGEYPQCSLIADANGDLFGTTSYGGASGYGTVFEIVNNGSLSAPSYASTPATVVSFNGSNGAYPLGSLIADANGDLFGTTWEGGANNDGAIFEIVNNGTAAAPSYASTPTILASFNGSNGEYLHGSLIADANGDLFGTTSYGGASGYGTVFEIVNNGSLSAPSYASTPTILASFNGSNGAGPLGSLISDADGDLFGTTYEGGAGGYGTVFEIVNNGSLSAPSYASTPTILASFYGGGNGAYPRRSLIADANGDLFGTTEGGANGYGAGTVFEIAKTASGYAGAHNPGHVQLQRRRIPAKQPDRRRQRRLVWHDLAGRCQRLRYGIRDRQ